MTPLRVSRRTENERDLKLKVSLPLELSICPKLTLARFASRVASLPFGIFVFSPSEWLGDVRAPERRAREGSAALPSGSVPPSRSGKGLSS